MFSVNPEGTIGKQGSIKAAKLDGSAIHYRMKEVGQWHSTMKN
jgi:hypothetical protein